MYPIGEFSTARSYYKPEKLTIQSGSSMNESTLTARVIDPAFPTKCLFLTTKHGAWGSLKDKSRSLPQTKYISENTVKAEDLGTVYAKTKDTPDADGYNAQHDAALIEVKSDLFKHIRPGVFNVTDAIRGFQDVNNGDIVISHGMGSGIKYGVVISNTSYNFTFRVSDPMGNPLDLAGNPDILSPGGNSGSPVLLYRKANASSIQSKGILAGMVNSSAYQASTGTTPSYYFDINAITINSILDSNKNEMYYSNGIKLNASLQLFQY